MNHEGRNSVIREKQVKNRRREAMSQDRRNKLQKSDGASDAVIKRAVALEKVEMGRRRLRAQNVEVDAPSILAEEGSTFSDYRSVRDIQEARLIQHTRRDISKFRRSTIVSEAQSENQSNGSRFFSSGKRMKYPLRTMRGNEASFKSRGSRKLNRERGDDASQFSEEAFDNSRGGSGEDNGNEDFIVKPSIDSLFNERIPQPYMTFPPPSRHGLLAAYFQFENKIIESLSDSVQQILNDCDLFPFYPSPTFGGIKGIRSIFGVVFSIAILALIIYLFTTFSLSFFTRADPLFYNYQFANSDTNNVTVAVGVALTVNGAPYSNTSIISLASYIDQYAYGTLISSTSMNLVPCNFSDIPSSFSQILCPNSSTPLYVMGVFSSSAAQYFIRFEASVGSYCSTIGYNSTFACLSDPIMSSVWVNAELDILIPSRRGPGQNSFIDNYFSYVTAAAISYLFIPIVQVTVTDFKNVYTFFDSPVVSSYLSQDKTQQYYQYNTSDDRTLVWSATLISANYFSQQLHVYENVFDLLGTLGGLSYILTAILGGLIVFYNSQLFYYFYTWDLEPIESDQERIHQAVDTKSFPVDAEGIPSDRSFIRYDPPTQIAPYY